MKAELLKYDKAMWEKKKADIHHEPTNHNYSHTEETHTLPNTPELPNLVKYMKMNQGYCQYFEQFETEKSEIIDLQSET